MSDLPSALPLERIVDLGRLSAAGEQITLEPAGPDLARLATWAEVSSIEKFSAKVDVKRIAPNRFRLDGAILADLTQACVVTLEPVKDHIERSFSRELNLVRPLRHAAPEPEALAAGAGEDDAPEEIDNPRYDMAGPVLEEFSLAINPYPRSPGAEFESVTDPAAPPDNPFAVLKSLKT